MFPPVSKLSSRLQTDYSKHHGPTGSTSSPHAVTVLLNSAGLRGRPKASMPVSVADPAARCGSPTDLELELLLYLCLTQAEQANQPRIAQQQ